ncbi:NAD(P)/FAD-dependent oxidoreductase [Campylobacter corcagiensis]|uniref:NAD(P)/FAD-dependent oxidoreductase n=1 Tax=Campylobacter corcagiensis TaxID=1448857 RepID=A0A7M1LI08_9BACT|nr:FAD/NAD(P)-binding oxidoreductase [Campylobacter corcagiensis]QKF64306.1 putative NADH dehydrogenase [Campylobacter corcagiensis]QOQ87506.1 NAD(P)/FAD-dependent oxidoreductase [Campylobacter corcagiensis]
MNQDQILDLKTDLVNELTNSGLSRRDALKLLGLVPFMLSATPSVVSAKSQSSASANILIVGGGAAGCTVANFISKNIPNATITIIEPDENSIKYQPGQTMIGGGLWKSEDILKDTKDFLPKDAKWIKDIVVEFNPDNNLVKTKNSGKLSYDFLICATGLELNFEGIEGISKDIIGTNGVGSIYLFSGAEKTWGEISKFVNSATPDKVALFSEPAGSIKCGGAPKKIAFLTSARLREAKKQATLNFRTNKGNFFGTKVYNDSTIKYMNDRNIYFNFKSTLVSVDVGSKTATFKDENEGLNKINYDFIHIVPPMRTVKAVRENSDLANEKGWVDVDKFSTIHKKYDNIFAIGDNSSLPTSKTGAAIREQYKVLGENLISRIDGKELKAKYDGYTACPLITDIGRVMMAEFNYQNEPAPSLPFLDPAKERWIWWLVKAYLLKPMYFYGMLKARA